MIAIVAEHGIEGLSVRKLAERSMVSIGTVQYYFPTKDAMLVDCFQRIVDRISARVAGLESGSARRRLRSVLCQLLPLDRDRADEARVMIAFSAAAATQPALAEVQRRVLDGVIQAIAPCFTEARAGTRTSADDRRLARIALACVDGLTLHALSAPGSLDARDLVVALDRLLGALVG